MNPRSEDKNKDKIEITEQTTQPNVNEGADLDLEKYITIINSTKSLAEKNELINSDQPTEYKNAKKNIEKFLSQENLSQSKKNKFNTVLENINFIDEYIREYQLSRAIEEFYNSEKEFHNVMRQTQDILLNSSGELKSNEELFLNPKEVTEGQRERLISYLNFCKELSEDPFASPNPSLDNIMSIMDNSTFENQFKNIQNCILLYDSLPLNFRPMDSSSFKYPSVSSLLITPIQRLPRYRLLLQEIVNHQPNNKDDPLNNKIRATHQHIHTQTSSANDTKKDREKERTDALINITQHALIEKKSWIKRIKANYIKDRSENNSTFSKQAQQIIKESKKNNEEPLNKIIILGEEATDNWKMLHPPYQAALDKLQALEISSPEVINAIDLLTFYGLMQESRMKVYPGSKDPLTRPQQIRKNRQIQIVGILEEISKINTKEELNQYLKSLSTLVYESTGKGLSGASTLKNLVNDLIEKVDKAVLSAPTLAPSSPANTNAPHTTTSSDLHTEATKITHDFQAVKNSQDPSATLDEPPSFSTPSPHISSDVTSSTLAPSNSPDVQNSMPSIAGDEDFQEAMEKIDFRLSEATVLADKARSLNSNSHLREIEEEIQQLQEKKNKLHQDPSTAFYTLVDVDYTIRHKLITHQIALAGIEKNKPQQKILTSLQKMTSRFLQRAGTTLDNIRGNLGEESELSYNEQREKIKHLEKISNSLDRNNSNLTQQISALATTLEESPSFSTSSPHITSDVTSSTLATKDSQNRSENIDEQPPNEEKEMPVEPIQEYQQNVLEDINTSLLNNREEEMINDSEIKNAIDFINLSRDFLLAGNDDDFEIWVSSHPEDEERYAALVSEIKDSIAPNSNLDHLINSIEQNNTNAITDYLKQNPKLVRVLNNCNNTPPLNQFSENQAIPEQESQNENNFPEDAPPSSTDDEILTTLKSDTEAYYEDDYLKDIYQRALTSISSLKERIHSLQEASQDLLPAEDFNRVAEKLKKSMEAIEGTEISLKNDKDQAINTLMFLQYTATDDLDNIEIEIESKKNNLSEVKMYKDMQKKATDLRDHAISTLGKETAESPFKNSIALQIKGLNLKIRKFTENIHIIANQQRALESIDNHLKRAYALEESILSQPETDKLKQTLTSLHSQIEWLENTKTKAHNEAQTALGIQPRFILSKNMLRNIEIELQNISQEKILEQQLKNNRDALDHAKKELRRIDELLISGDEAHYINLAAERNTLMTLIDGALNDNVVRISESLNNLRNTLIPPAEPEAAPTPAAPIPPSPPLAPATPSPAPAAATSAPLSDAATVHTIAPSDVATPKSKQELQGEANGITMALQEMRDKQNRSKNLLNSRDTALFKHLRTLHALFERSQKSANLVSEQNIEKTVRAMEQLKKEIMKEIDSSKPKNLSSANVEKVCDDAIRNVQARKNFLPAWQVDYKEVNTTDAADYKAKLEQVYSEAKKNSKSPSTTDGHAGVLDGMPTLSSPTDLVTTDRFLEGKMANGAHFVKRIDEARNAHSELIALPDTICTREDIMAKLSHTSLKGGVTLNEKQLRDMFKELDRIGRRDGTGITQESIAQYFKDNSLPHPNDNSKRIFDAYTKRYVDEMYKIDDKSGKQFPKDDLFRMAIQQVNDRLSMDPQPPIVIKKAFSPAYAEAIMLYCATQNLAVKNETQYKGIENKINKNYIKDARAYLERSTDLGYDIRQAQHRKAIKKGAPELVAEISPLRKK